ncbi:hypothetical protein SAMN05421820_10141 [Pedobacter steynii]|uniref:Uncharacterized protein n=1 Tax=Pedobacter steynii TaxID=430522 RepID=A0A1G9IRX5_9SPHI|nr:hypothetical protein SAMN05421820_10141 [Pedobacter steynii]
MELPTVLHDFGKDLYNISETNKMASPVVLRSLLKLNPYELQAKSAVSPRLYVKTWTHPGLTVDSF